jgi:NADPH2:quinone reductase
VKAAVFDAFGDADVMHLADVPKPEVRETDLLIHVRAAGVNRADLTQRRGGYGWPDFGDSTLMGLEIAGEVVTMGAKTRSFKLGDRVMGIVGGGGYGEFARIDYRMAMPIPPNLSYTLAAAVPEVFVTAHEALIHLGRLQAGDTVLIHAAAGGVGSAAVQLAHAQGARIFASADYNKLDRVQEFGADVGIDRNGQDFAEVIASKMANRGVDVIIDFIGAPYFERNLASLSHGGRLAGC